MLWEDKENRGSGFTKCEAFQAQGLGRDIPGTSEPIESTQSEAVKALRHEQQNFSHQIMDIRLLSGIGIGFSCSIIAFVLGCKL